MESPLTEQRTADVCDPRAQVVGVGAGQEPSPALCGYAHSNYMHTFMIAM